MKQKKAQRCKLLRIIGLYLICLLAAFLTWIAVMYAEEKNAKEDLDAPSEGAGSYAAVEIENGAYLL